MRRFCTVRILLVWHSRKGINAGTRKWAEELDKDRDDK